MVNVGIIGLGYWGPNLLRNFYQHPKARVIGICDLNKDKLNKYINQYRDIGISTLYFEDLLNKDIR